MTYTEANRVASALKRHGMNINAIRRYHAHDPASWAVEATDPRTDTPVTVHDAGEWGDIAAAASTPTAGRPPVYGERMTARTIRCTDDTWAWILAQGIDYSDGVRKMAAEHKQAKEDA